MLANNSKIGGNDTAVARADHSSQHLPHHHHLHPHHHRFSLPHQSHLSRSHCHEQQQQQHHDHHHHHQHQHQQYQEGYCAFEQSRDSASVPHNSSKSSSPGLIIQPSSSSLSLTSTFSPSSSLYSYNQSQRQAHLQRPRRDQHALPPFLHHKNKNNNNNNNNNSSGFDGRTGSPPLPLPPSPFVPQRHYSLHSHPPPSPLPLSFPVLHGRQSPPVGPTIAAPPTPAPISDTVSDSQVIPSSSSSSSFSLSLPKRTPITATDMDIDEMTTQQGGRQQPVEEGGEQERIELLKSESSSAMDQCEPQRGWSPSSSPSSQHSSSLSPSSMVPARIMKRHSYGGHSKDEPHYRRDEEMCWRGDQDRPKRSDRHGYEYEYNDGRQEEGKGQSRALSLRALGRSQSEHRLMYRPDFAEDEEGGLALESHRQKKHARVARTDPFPRARGAMATAATLGATPGAARVANKSTVLIGPDHTIQRDRKHHSWPLVAQPHAHSPLSSRPLSASPLTSPSDPDAAMAVAAPRTDSPHLPMAPYPRSLPGTNLLKRRQSSPTPSPSMRRAPSFGYMSEAQRTLYERHPPSPSPPFSPPGLSTGAPQLGAQRSLLSLSPQSLRSPKVESVQESNYVHGNAQTPMQHRLPPISKDGYLQGDEQDELGQEEDHHSWYDSQQPQQQQEQHHDHPHRHRFTKLLPRIKAPPTDDFCRPHGLIEPPLYSSSSSSSESSNHSFSAESSISPTYPPSTYLPPPYPSNRSSSVVQPNIHRHAQAPQQQHSMYRDPYPPSQHQQPEQSHISFEHHSASKQPQSTHVAQPWSLPGYRSSSSDQQSTIAVNPHQQNHQNHHIQQQRHPGQRPPSVEYRGNDHRSHNSVVHRSLHQSSPAFASSSSSLHVIKNKAEGAIMVFNPQTESMTFKCELCPFESFGRIHDLKRHQTSKHKEMTWPCDFCHRPFVRRDALLRHYTVKAARDDGLHPASHEVEKLLEARARAKMLY
ncbi:hypothetical protein EMPS_05518 [Entomortierella parvispora]|uniref:C2H2-type domain-containing protein n=1 Tax=Entomortierella parvispora TaxID=205924 RepID=A0A9P3HAW3_9FUNG|nr:hypothetical protein EMPS_05518 [Entomortierella parvispora]